MASKFLSSRVVRIFLGAAAGLTMLLLGQAEAKTMRPESLRLFDVGRIITVANPGQHQNIQPALQAAVKAASAGDTLLLPAGEFYVDGQVTISNKFISIKGQGRASGGTMLYRREDVADSILEGTNWRYMFYIECNSDLPSHIVVSDMYLKGKQPSLSPNDGLSAADDTGIILSGCVDFVIANNRFENFGHAAITVVHKDRLARGLISHNEFVHNLKVDAQETRGTTTGYGVVVGSEDKTWVASPQFGTGNFIFIEDNYFMEQRHAVAGAGAGLYVFRYNTVVDNLGGQAVDAHGGGMYDNVYSTRAYEAYANNIYNTKFRDGVFLSQTPTNSICNDLTYVAMNFRGGEGLIYSNTIRGFRYGIGVTTEITGTYPVITQIGYQSAVTLGSANSGSDETAGAGDLFEWNNNFVSFDKDSCIAKYKNSQPTLLVENRDYHWATPKPNYTPYPYPHPLNNLVSNTASPSPLPGNTPIFEFTSQAISNPNTTLSLDGPPFIVAGQTFKVNVKARNVPDPGLYGIQLELNYTPTLVSVSNLQVSPSLSFVVLNNADNTTGKIRLIASQQGNVSGLTGDITVLSFDALAANPGRATFTFDNPKMSNLQAQDFNLVNQNYNVVVQSPQKLYELSLCLIFFAFSLLLLLLFRLRVRPRQPPSI